MRRRDFLLACAALGAGATQARAQPKLRRIGWLTGGSPKSHAKLLEAFRAGVKEHGWVEGKNLALELRWAEGRIDRVPALAAELVQPTRLSLIVNLKTAKAQGIEIPREIVLRADRVIE